MFSTLGNQLSVAAAYTKEDWSDIKDDLAGIKNDLQDILRLIEALKTTIEIQSNEEVIAENSAIEPCNGKNVSDFSFESSTPQAHAASSIGNLGHNDCTSRLDNYSRLLRFLNVCRHSPESATSPLSLTTGISAKGITAVLPLRLLFGHADLSAPPLGFLPLTAVNATDTGTWDGTGWRCLKAVM
jgi:hypothetical protein